MDANAKKMTLRMIPYGLYVLTAEHEGRIAAATVNWVTQASFEPPLLVTAVKKDSATFEIVRASGAFALNVLGKGQNDVAFAFFKPVELAGDMIGGQRFRRGTTGAPILEALPAFVECHVRTVVDEGDHAVVVGLVVDAGVAKAPDGRADEATLWLKDLGEKMFYGG